MVINTLNTPMKRYSIILLFSFATIAVAQSQQQPDAQKLYKSKCARCHGKSGDKGLFHASKLSQSKLDDASVVLLIQEGKGIMPSFSKKLTVEEVEAVVGYIKLLRK